MANKFFDHVSGIISVILKGKNHEKIINMALARGIYVWNIKKTSAGLNLKIRASGLKALQNITDENGCVMEIKKEQGLPFLKRVVKRRLGFISGAIIFVLALYFLSAFIWFIGVSGNKAVHKNRILIAAAKQGVYKGAPKWKFSKNDVEEAMLCDISELTYVNLKVSGVKVNIEVVEKIFPKSEITGPCHIVAAKDGVIEEILVLDGQAKVEKGDVVAKQDMLISGIVYPEISPFISNLPEEEIEPYSVRARGIVKAKVWYEGYGECKPKLEKVVFTGRETRKISIETPWKSFVIKGSTETFGLAQEIVDKKTIKTPLGEFGTCTVITQQQITETTAYTQDQMMKIAKDKAMAMVSRQLGKDHQVTDNKVEILSAPSDPILRTKVAIEVIEDIALAKPLNEGVNSN